MNQSNSNDEKPQSDDHKADSHVPLAPEPSITSTCKKDDDVTDGGENKCQYKQPDNVPFWIQAISSILMFFCTVAIAVITYLYAGYAFEQVAQMKEAVKTQIAQNKLDQRAWMGITKVTGNMEIGKPIIIIIEFRNVGKTPAKKVTSSPVIVATEVRDRPDFDYEKTLEKTSRGIVAPQQPIFIIRKAFSDWEDHHRDSLIKDVLSGTKRFYVHGILDYEDIFKCPHWLTYCFFFNGESFIIDPEHNDTDDN